MSKKKDNFRDGDDKRQRKSWRKCHLKRTVGSRRSPVEEAWLKIKDHLDEIGRLYENGATLAQIAEAFGIRRCALYELRKRKPELEKVLADSAGAREDLIVSDMWRLARGTATSVEETEMRDSSGKLRGSQKKTIRPLPNLSAQLALLKHHHGWSDNPKVDDAVANALSAAEWNAKSAEVFSALGDPRVKSSAADNFSAPPRNCQPTSCPSQSDGPSSSSQSDEEQKHHSAEAEGGKSAEEEDDNER